MAFEKRTVGGTMRMIGAMRMHGTSVYIGVSKYQPPYDDRVAVLAMTASGELYGKMSVNIVEREMEPGEFVVSHDVSEKDRAALLKCGAKIEDTGKTVSYGFVKDQPVFRVVGLDDAS